MSINARPPTKSNALKVTVPLDGAETYTLWNKQVQAYVFRTLKISDFNQITSAAILDDKYFKKIFATEHAAASKDADDNAQHPFVDPGFVTMCLNSATATGAGFLDWVYDVYAEVFNSLSPKIQEKVGQQLGDLVGLFSEIKLAIHHYEVHDAGELTIQFIKSNMQHDGKNDMMTFLAHLRHLMARLAAAQQPIADKQAMAVLLAGLPQDMFEAFIISARRTPYANYAELEQALKADAATPHRLTQLRALQPGQREQVFAMSSEALPVAPVPSPIEARLDRLESIVAELAIAVKTATAKRELCGNFKSKGTCRFGDTCKYEHSGYRPQTPAAPALVNTMQGLEVAASAAFNGFEFNC